MTMFQISLTRRQFLVQGATAVLVGSTAGCLDGVRTSSRTVTMTDDLRFDPETIRIGGDTKIVWENPTSANHTVTAIEDSLPKRAPYFASGNFDSEREAREHTDNGLIEPEGTYSHTFRRPGSYEYVCLPHEKSGMTGTVVVTEADGTG